MKCDSLCVEENQPSDELIRKFMNTFRKVNSALRPGNGEHFPKHKSFFVLHFLHHQHVKGKELVRLSDVGADLQLAPPTVTLMLNGLEKDGYIERVRDQEDRRVVWVRLTDKGDQTMKAMFQQARAQTEKVINCLGQEDTEQLLMLMQRAITCLQESRNPDA